MKNIIYAVVLSAVLVSCGRLDDYKTSAYVSFGVSSYTVDENVGTVIVPVNVFNTDGKPVTITVGTTDGAAVKGVNYEIMSPETGVLEFSGKETEKNVIISIKDLSGKFTGNLDFSLTLASATDWVVSNSYNVVKFAINDLDDPRAPFIGNWSGTAVATRDGQTYNMDVSISADPEDKTYSKLIVKDIDPYIVELGGTSAKGIQVYTAELEDDGKSFVIAAGTPSGYLDSTYGEGYLFGATEDGLTDFVGTMQQDGKIIIESMFGTYFQTTPGKYGFRERYSSGIVLTKK